MTTGVWLHPWDLLDNGVENVLTEILEYGFDTVSLAVRYVEERQAYPGASIIYRNPRRRVYMSPRQGLYWLPEEKYYKELPEHVRPKPVQGLERNLVYEFRKTAEDLGLKPVYWLPTLRWDWIAGLYPEYAVKDLYDGVAGYKAQFLCPLNPTVRRLVKSVVEELSTRLEAVEIELDYIRYPEPPTLSPNPFTELLQMPCFCEHCRKYYSSKGIDLDQVAKSIREKAEAYIKAEDATGIICEHGDHECSRKLVLNALYELLREEQIGKWIIERAKVIADLVAEIRDITKQYGTELSADLTTPSTSWMVGQDYKLLSKLLDRVKIMLYTEPFGRSPKMIPYELLLAREAGFKEIIAGIAVWPPASPSTIRRDILLAKPFTNHFYAYSYGWAPSRNLEEFIRVIEEV